MGALENRIIKSKLVDVLESKGFKVSVTDSSRIVVFTNKQVNEKSTRLPKSEAYNEPFITSFGVKGALKYIEENKVKYRTIFTGEF